MQDVAREKTNDTTTPAAEPASYYRLEVQAREWAGTLRDGWRPAVAGTLNQTHDDDDTASLFDTLHGAQDFAERFVMPEEPDRWRIVRSDGVVVLVVDLTLVGYVLTTLNE